MTRSTAATTALGKLIDDCDRMADALEAKQFAPAEDDPALPPEPEVAEVLLYHDGNPTARLRASAPTVTTILRALLAGQNISVATPPDAVPADGMLAEA